MKFGSIGPVVSEEKMFENVDNNTHKYMHTYGRQRPTYAISSPMSLKAQVSYSAGLCI